MYEVPKTTQAQPFGECAVCGLLSDTSLAPRTTSDGFGVCPTCGEPVLMFDEMAKLCEIRESELAGTTSAGEGNLTYRARHVVQTFPNVVNMYRASCKLLFQALHRLLVHHATFCGGSRGCASRDDVAAYAIAHYRAAIMRDFELNRFKLIAEKSGAPNDQVAPVDCLRDALQMVETGKAEPNKVLVILLQADDANYYARSLLSNMRSSEVVALCHIIAHDFTNSILGK